MSHEEDVRFEAILRTTPIPTVVTRMADQRYVAASESFLEMVGYTREELIGHSSIELGVWADPGDRARMIAGLAARGTVRNLEARFRTKDGTIRTALVTFERLEFRGEASIFSLVNDITALRKIEEERRHAAKMEVVGQLAGGVAHDFNNMLQVISGFCATARKGLPPGHPVQSDLEQIAQAADRASTLTRQLLAFSHRQLLQPEVLDANAVVATTRRMVSRLLPENVRLDLVLDLLAPRFHGDRSQLEQALLNLCVNARDAMPGGGTITITISRPPPDGEAARRRPEVAGGGWLQIAVSDTGTGMDAVTRERAFEPFFTTKPVGRGTGFGLATVYSVVRQCGGEVWIDSEIGRGTTVTLILPGTTDLPAPMPAATATPARGGAGETVLVVEDEPLVRRLAVHLLTRSGYRVLEAADGYEGLGRFERHADEIHLVLSDMMMPGLDGVQLGRRIHELRPKVPIVYMSGWAGETVPSGVEARAWILEKPFTAERLLAAVRDAIGRDA